VGLGVGPLTGWNVGTAEGLDVVVGLEVVGLKDGVVGASDHVVGEPAGSAKTFARDACSGG